MAEKSPKQQVNIFIVLFFAIIGTVVFYGCGGVSSDNIPEAECIITGLIRPNAALQSTLTSLASLRGANYSGIEVWTVADGYGRRVLTDEDGRYTIITKPGTHRICAKFMVGNEVYRAVSKPMEAVRNTGENKAPTLELSTCSVIVKGHIVDSSGYAPAGVTNITVLGEPITVNPNGWYETPLMPEGWIEDVVINVGGYQEVRQTVNFEENTPYIENTIVRNNETNRAPYITVASGTPRTASLNKGESVRLYVGFADLDNDIATWSWNIAVSDGSSVGSFSEYTNDRGRTYSSVSWRAPEADIVATITFIVKDYGNLVAKTMFCYRVAAGKPNSAPVINDVLCDGVSVLADSAIQGRSKHEFVAFANDPDQDKIIYKWSLSYEYEGNEYKEDRFTSEVNGGKNINGTASASTIFAKFPSNNNPLGDAYVATLTLTVEDIYGAKAVQQYPISITPDPENTLPIIDLATATIVNVRDIAAYGNAGGYGAGAFHVKSGGTLKLSIIATDTEGEALEYAWNDTSTLASGTFSNTLSSSPTINWVAPYSYSETGTPVTITVRVYDIDPDTGLRLFYYNAYGNRVYYHYTERTINVKVYKGDYGIPRVVFREKDGSSFVGKSYIKADTASLTANLVASYSAIGGDIEVGMPIKQYRWSYTYDRTNADGTTYNDPEIHYLEGSSVDSYWVTTGLVNGNYPASTSYTWPAGNDAGTYTIRFEARGWNDENVYSNAAPMYVNATPTIQLAIATDTTQFPTTRAREARDLDGNKILVVNEGETFVLVSRIKDEFWETSHELCWTIEGIASFTETKNSGNSGTNFPFDYQATRQINTGSFGSLVPGTPITLKLGVKDTLEEAATSSSVIIEYNAKPKNISISYDPPMAHDDRNCYYTEESINLTVSSEDVETGKDMIGHNGVGGIVWEYAKKTGSSYGAYNVLPYVGYNPGNPATGTAANVTLNCSALGVGTYKLRVTVTDNMFGSTTWTDDEHEFVIAGHQNLVWSPEPTNVLTFLQNYDPDENGNTNPAVVTLGKSFDLAVSYTGSERQKVEWKYKPIDAANYTDMSVNGTALNYTVPGTLITAPGTYTVRCNVIGTNNESTSITYDIRVNSQPEVTLTFIPELGAGVTAYNKGQNLRMRLNVTDVEDSNVVVETTTVSYGALYGKFSFTGPINQTGITNPYTFNTVGEYEITGVVTDTLGAKATATANIIVSNTPTVAFTAATDANEAMVLKDANFFLNITVGGIDSMEEVDSIKWIDKITDLGGTTSDVTGSFDLRTAPDALVRLYLNNSKPAAANHDYGVIVTLKSGLTACATHTMRINEVPTSSEISITTNTEFQSGLYDKTLPMDFQITSTDSDINDMPTFKWYVTPPGGTRNLERTKTVTILDLQAGDQSKVDTFTLGASADDGTYLIECEITDDTGAAAETRSISVIRTTNVVINDFVVNSGGFNPTYRLTSDTSSANFRATLVENYNSLRDTVTWTLDNATLSGTPNYSGTNLNYEVTASQLIAVGTHTIRVTLTNAYGVVASKSYDLYLNQIPTISDITITDKYNSSEDIPDPLNNLNYVLHATSSDGDPKDAIKFVWRVISVIPAGDYSVPNKIVENINSGEMTAKEDVIDLSSLTPTYFKMDRKYTVECGVIDSWGESCIASSTITFSTNTKPVILDIKTEPDNSQIIDGPEEYDGKNLVLIRGTGLEIDMSIPNVPAGTYVNKEIAKWYWYEGDSPVGPADDTDLDTDMYNDTFKRRYQYTASVSVIVEDVAGDKSDPASLTYHIARYNKIYNGSQDYAINIDNDVKDILTISSGIPYRLVYVNDLYGVDRRVRSFNLYSSASPVYANSVWSEGAGTDNIINSATIVSGESIITNEKIMNVYLDEEYGFNLMQYSTWANDSPPQGGEPATRTIYLHDIESHNAWDPGYTEVAEFKSMAAVENKLVYALGKTNTNLYAIAIGPDLSLTFPKDPAIIDPTDPGYSEETIQIANATVRRIKVNDVDYSATKHIRFFDNRLYLTATDQSDSKDYIFIYDSSAGSEMNKYQVDGALDVYKAANHLFILTSNKELIIAKDTLPQSKWTKLDCSSFITTPESLQYFKDSDNNGYLLIYDKGGQAIKIIWLGPASTGEW